MPAGRDGAGSAAQRLIVDGTGAKFERSAKRIQEAKDHGWRTKLLHVSVTLDTAIERNAARKRQVPREVLEQYESQVLASVFALAALVDDVEVVQNDTHDGLTGRERWGGALYGRYNEELSGSGHLCSPLPSERWWWS